MHAVARDEPFEQQLSEHKRAKAGFTPIYKHPLPFGDEVSYVQPTGYA